MKLSQSRKLILGAAVAAATVIALVAPASAHGRHRHHFGFRAPIVLAPSYTASCDYYHWKWQRTGSRYWRSQYFACIH
jgi:hypothetical protein